MSLPRSIPSYRPRGGATIGLVEGTEVRPTPDFTRWLDGLRFRVQDVQLPAGSLQSFLGSNQPDGWLICNGQTVSKSAYGDLYAVVGDTFGADTDTFTLPDLTDRFLVGAGDIALLATGGAGEITLATTNLPAHNHGVTDPGHTHTITDPGHGHTVTDPGHTHGVTDSGHTHGGVADPAGAADSATGSDTTSAASGSTDSATTGVAVDSATTGLTVDSGTTGVTAVSATTGITTDNTGDGTAFSIVPPALGVTWLIKT